MTIDLAIVASLICGYSAKMASLTDEMHSILYLSASSGQLACSCPCASPRRLRSSMFRHDANRAAASNPGSSMTNGSQYALTSSKNKSSSPVWLHHAGISGMTQVAASEFSSKAEHFGMGGQGDLQYNKRCRSRGAKGLTQAWKVWG